MPTITFDVVPFFFAVLMLMLNVYMSGEESGIGTGWIHVLICVITTVLTYVLFVGVIALCGG